MAKTRGKPRSQRCYPTNTEGMHRAYFVKGTEDRATAVRLNGVMVWRDTEGSPCEVELKPTGVKCVVRITR